LHYHTLVMESLFYQDEQGQIKSVPVENLGHEDCIAITEKVRVRVLKLFQREGVLTSDQVETMQRWKNSGFSVNGDVGIDATDRKGLNRVIRYCASPAFSDKQVLLTENALIKFELSNPSQKGETILLLRPFEFIDKLTQIIPKPRRHRHHYHRVLAPASLYRKHVVAYAGQLLPETLGDQKPPSIVARNKIKAEQKLRHLWAILLSRVYELMPLKCPACRG